MPKMLTVKFRLSFNNIVYFLDNCKIPFCVYPNIRLKYISSRVKYLPCTNEYIDYIVFTVGCTYYIQSVTQCVSLSKSQIQHPVLLSGHWSSSCQGVPWKAACGHIPLT